ncbi:ribonuclease H-like domain-containing protein [Tanacetum coccineum]|uniref:Ribonuclease H-like domain-containing protein n=1 Tax=Tanacetum coccineum TaxID=301880 RepID=A0ABQ5D6W9_9ASTR
MEFAREEQLIKEQGEKDAEIARAQAEKELGMMIAELDRSNELIAKYITEYEQAEADLSLEENMELITELIKYQRNLAEIKKYQAQQSKPSTKIEKRNFYMAILKSHAGWKSKDFRGMTFEQIEEKFIPVWKQLQDFVPMNFKTESERVKRPGIQLAQESSKRLKTAKASGSEPSQEHQTKDSKELSEEELKKMMEIVPIEEVYIEALQAKYPIIEWEIYSEEQRKYWKIIRVGNHTEVYQTFEEMLKRFDREDLDRLWSLVKKTFSTTDPTEDKEKELWVELKRLYEPDPRDQLWALQRYMHDPLEWRLYDTCGVHHVSTERGHEIFMLVEKDYPLTKGLTTLLLGPETPLLVGRGFLATANAVIDCRIAKIAVGEGITRSVFGVKGIELGQEEAPYWTTLGKRESYKLRPSTDGVGAQTLYYARKDFLDCHLPREWEIARDAKINPFKDVLVFRRMVEFVGAIPINLKRNISRKSEVPTVQGVSTASAQVSTASTNVVAASLSYDTICAFIATQPNASFDKSKVECFNCHKMGHFARECRSPNSQKRGKRESYKKDPKVEEHAPKAMIAIDGIVVRIGSYYGSWMMEKHASCCVEEEGSN